MAEAHPAGADPAAQPERVEDPSAMLWVCDHCGDLAECEPGEECEVCAKGTIQRVPYVPESALDALRGSNDGLLDAIERLNATIERQERELTDLRQIAGLDPDALLAAERERDALREVAEELAEALREARPSVSSCAAWGKTGTHDTLKRIDSALAALSAPSTGGKE